MQLNERNKFPKLKIPPEMEESVNKILSEHRKNSENTEEITSAVCGMARAISIQLNVKINHSEKL